MSNVRVLGQEMTEADWQKRVMDYAKLRGWHVVHYRPARLVNGQWRTAFEGDVGAPDLILARNGRVILAELKSDKGTTTGHQDAWLMAAGVNGFLWRPKHWPAVMDELK